MTDLSPDTTNTTEPLAFGEPLFKLCDNCNQPVAIVPMLTGNPIGGALWSDGYMDAPQLPEQELLGKCAHCGEILSLAELPDHPDPAAIGNADDHAFEHLAMDDYGLLIENFEQVDASYHLFLRLKYWQLGNHPRRESETEIPLSGQETENLQQMLLLFGDDEPDRLLKAEVFRQLGEFERAESALVGPFQPQVKDLVARLRELVRLRQSTLDVIFR